MKLLTYLFICSFLFSSLKCFALATFRVKMNKPEHSGKILRKKLTNEFSTIHMSMAVTAIKF